MGLVCSFVRLIIRILKKLLRFFSEMSVITSNAGVDKNKIEAIDSEEMRRRENLGTGLPRGYIYTLFSC